MKKIIFIFIFIFFIVVLSSCKNPYEDNYFPEYESTYYRYAVEVQKDGTKVGYLVGLTELGQKQTTLILPNEINGIKIKGIGYMRRSAIFAIEKYGSFHSDNLQKLFINFDTYDDNDWINSYSYGTLPNAFIFIWSDKNLVIFNMYKGVVCTFNDYSKTRTLSSNSTYTYKIANLSYMYNYENSPHDGYYWIDSYDNSTVDFIPPTPIRDGYTFDGWYKEPECINKWDFNIDKTKDEILLTEIYQYDEYLGISLYAKWV